MSKPSYLDKQIMEMMGNVFKQYQDYYDKYKLIKSLFGNDLSKCVIEIYHTVSPIKPVNHYSRIYNGN